MDRRYRKVIIAGNWKMNSLASEVKPFAEQLKELLPRAKWCEVVLCVPTVMIAKTVKSFRDSKTMVGAQDISAFAKGAYTGEVSGAQLVDVGTKYVIVGHSERRQYHAEIDELIAKKAKAALEAGLIPIVCVGETLEQREVNVTFELLALQVKVALAGLNATQVKKTVIAYEPVWAIGTGKTASAEEAAAACKHIRAVVREVYGARVSRAVSILYGGSMNPQNAEELLSQADIDGGLIGGASLKAEDFAKIIHAANQ